MSVIYVVFGLGLLVVAGALAAFIWAAKSGQYDDLDTPSIRMIVDDE